MSSRPRRPMRFSDRPGDPSPTIVPSEWSAEELTERYVAQQRAAMMARRQAAEGKGDGDQAATPTRHADDDPDTQAPPRHRLGSR